MGVIAGGELIAIPALPWRKTRGFQISLDPPPKKAYGGVTYEGYEHHILQG